MSGSICVVPPTFGSGHSGHSWGASARLHSPAMKRFLCRLNAEPFKLGRVLAGEAVQSSGGCPRLVPPPSETSGGVAGAAPSWKMDAKAVSTPGAKRKAQDETASRGRAPKDKKGVPWGEKRGCAGVICGGVCGFGGRTCQPSRHQRQLPSPAATAGPSCRTPPHKGCQAQGGGGLASYRRPDDKWRWCGRRAAGAVRQSPPRCTSNYRSGAW